MPSLVLFGRRTLLAGDDLRLWALMSSSIKLAEIGVCIPLLVYLAPGNSFDDSRGSIKEACDNSNAGRPVKNLLALLYSYVLTSSLSAASGILLAARVWALSRTGTPTIQGKRQRIQPLCHLNLTLLFSVSISLLVLGIVVRSNFLEYCKCGVESNSANLSSKCGGNEGQAYDLLNALGRMNFADCCFAVLMMIYFGCKCLPKCCMRISSEDQWKCCCRCCCTFSSILTCCMLGGRDSVTGDFSDVALILSDYFDGGGRLDVVPSDIYVGFLMLARVQAEKRTEAESNLKCQIKDIENPLDTGEPGTVTDGKPMQARQGESSAPLDTGGPGSVNDDDDMQTRLVEPSVPLYAGEPGSVNEDQTMQMRKVMSSGHSLSDDSRTIQVQRSLRGHIFYETQLLRDTLWIENPIDRSVIAEGAHFMRLSLAIYTWGMKTRNQPFTALCELLAISAGTSIRECCKRHTQFVSDNPCRFNQTALMREAGLKETEVVFAQFKVGYAPTPYCIVLDHEWKSIVIGIRGTLSLDDLLADMTLRPVSLEKLGELCGFDGTDRYVHSGMLACCEWIYRDIEKVGILASTVATYSTYDIRITGHSLGAGCAAILAILLRPRYPSIRVLAFSPPGCVMTKNLVDESKGYIRSYVLDCDIIPRLSLQSIENLRDGVLDMIDRIKVPKYHVLSGPRRAESIKTANQNVLHSADSIPATQFHSELQSFRIEYTERIRTRQFREVELWPPGEIVHLSASGQSKTPLVNFGCFEYSRKTKSYAACWADTADFREILLSSHLVKDHEPANVLRELEALAEQFGLKAPYNTAYVHEGGV